MKTTQIEQTPDFKIFEGPTHYEMPKLRKEGLIPASAAQIMRGWIEGKFDRDWYHDSGDAIIYDSDERAKLVWDSEDLRKLNKKSLLSEGSLVLPAGAFESIDGEVISRNEIEEYAGIAQSRDDVMENRFWRWLARDDLDLLGEYVGQMLDHVKQRDGYDQGMHVYVGNPKLDVPELHLWRLSGVNRNGFFDGYGAALGDYHSLDDDCYVSGGRLVGTLDTRNDLNLENKLSK